MHRRGSSLPARSVSSSRRPSPSCWAGESSRTLYIRTNASDYDTLGDFRVRVGPDRVTLASVAPQPVPEPGAPVSGLIAWLGLAALHARRTRCPARAG